MINLKKKNKRAEEIQQNIAEGIYDPSQDIVTKKSPGELRL